MPYKSDKQRRYFHAAEERGEIAKSVVDEFDQASKGKKLPELATRKDTSREKSARAFYKKRGLKGLD